MVAPTVMVDAIIVELCGLCESDRKLGAQCKDKERATARPNSKHNEDQAIVDDK